MKTTRLLFILLALLSVRGESNETMTTTSKDPIMKVLLSKDAKGALLEARGSYRVIRRKTGDVLSSGTTGKRFVAHALSDGLRWGEEYPGIFEISIIPTSSSSVLFVDGYQYKGIITLYSAKKGTICVVNELPLEEFVKGTLSAKVESQLPQEAVEALAIAERTNAYSKIFYHEGTLPWNSTAKEMGYFGMGLTKSHGVDLAVDKTSHVVMQANGGSPLRQVDITASTAKACAESGLDAKRILRKICPEGEIGMNITTKNSPQENPAS